jgi:hypothetical protein
VIYLRTDDDEIVAALAEAASHEVRSVNSYALEILASHLRACGYLD